MAFKVEFTQTGTWKEVTDKAFNHAALASKTATFDLFNNVIRRTPVDTGRARGNWQFQEGTPPTGTLDVEDKNGFGTLSKVELLFQKWIPWKAVGYFVNNLPYILRLENGWSKQARNPNGMVKVSVVEFGTLLTNALRSMD